MDKFMFFLDASNLYKGIKNLGLSGWKLTYLKILDFCKSFVDPKIHKLVRVYYYDAVFQQKWDKNRYETQQKFFARLNSQENIELRLGRLQGSYPNIYEKGIDSMLSVDLIRMAYNNSYDVAAVVSADGDYVPAIQLCKDMGKNIWNIRPKGLKAYHLSNVCDKTILFDSSSINKFQFPPPGKKPKTKK